MFVAVASNSCTRGAERAANDTGGRPDSLRADTTVAAPEFREWIGAAGRHLLVATESRDTALVVFPEFTIDSSLANVELRLNRDALAEFDLLATDGSSMSSRLTSLAAPKRPGCDGWPVGHVAAADLLHPWVLGLRAGRARGIALTALDRLQGRDSTTLVISLTRLASQAPNDTSTAFRGLPYVVRSAYTATLADSQALVLGELVRRVNIEASPHEERTLIIAEKAASTPTAPYALAFSERQSGDEESVPTTELTALVLLRDGTYAAFGARDYSDGGIYLMFARGQRPHWRLQWQSAYAGC
ncbi:MAG: hypothetical protein ACREOG_08645 [Gemmatimonadaceae bacterium]